MTTAFLDNEATTVTTVFMASAAATVILGTALAYVILKSSKSIKKEESIPDASACSISDDDIPELVISEAFPGGYLTVLYGSQTGTAAGFAKQICEESLNRGFKSRLVDMEDITTLEDLTAQVTNKSFRDENGKARVVVVVATYGEGEATDNATEMVRLLKQEMEGDETNNIFSNVEFCVFGLGNRQYEHFNAMGKFFDKSLQTLGGTRVLDISLGDDDQDLESDFDIWKEKLWLELAKRYSPSFVVETATNANGHSTKETSCPLELEYLPDLHGKSNIQPDSVSLDHVNKQTKHFFTAVDCPVSVARELRSNNDGGSTLHIEVDVSSRMDEMKYETAANLAILPVNSTSMVEKLAKALSFDLDAVFRLKPSKEDGLFLFPTPCSVRDCLSRYCDLTTPPRRSELSALANYATDALDKKALQRLASKDGREEYRAKILDPHVGIADIVSKLCPSIQIPLEHFINVCTRLQPRFYTISSSSSLHPHSVHLTVSVMRGDRKDGSGEWLGVCSGHLSNVSTAANDTRMCRVFVRNSTFRLPSDPARPIIMIGPGTGIAPMRAFLQERSYQKHQQKLPVGDNVLYFGCKRRDHDYLYEEELMQFQKEGTLTHLHVAFSREMDRKVYVQHLLAENAKDTWDLIDNKNASIYVCGGTKMGADVTDAITKLIADVGGKDVSGAKAYVERLRSESRFVQELWA